MSALTVSSLASPDVEYDARPVLYVVEAPAPVAACRRAPRPPRVRSGSPAAVAPSSCSPSSASRSA